jgi:alkylation response protein AidB-like acyl-CoA dehydrogenase
MPTYKAPLRDIRFVLNEVLDVQQLASLPGFEQATPDLVDPILDAAADLCENVLFPLNQSGDAEGCKWDNGTVTTPAGFKDAYKAFIAGGWTGLSCDPAYGGMGLPRVLNFVLDELVCGANMAFGLYPGLTKGAYDAIHTHGTEDQKNLYLPKLISGVWSGTMCLTEPHCGTDLGLMRTRAVPVDDGSYRITGTKIFISAGEHDLSENIIHLVLAKLPDAPEGVKGISLFVVPKFIPVSQGGDWVPGDRNKAVCGSLEHKMGIKANATCVMNFDDATGWLVGKPHEGLKAMFTMMNMERLGVGQQGLGLAEVSYQNGLAYARERLQMRALDGAKAPEKPADPIIVHPDVRRMLLTGKAFTEGARAMALWAGMNLDIATASTDPDTRQSADDLVALLTPIIKAYQTDMGFEVANLAIQVHGGHGYIRDYGVEQYARDARIAMIYEGTNGIQALDLIGRKMGQNMGRLLRQFFHPVQNFIDAHIADPEIGPLVMNLAKGFAKLQQATGLIAQKSLKDPVEAGAAATDYLRMFALVVMGFMWVRMARVALEKLAAGAGDDTVFYQTKIKTARFFFDRMFPEYESRYRMMMAGKESLMSHTQEEF